MSIGLRLTRAFALVSLIIVAGAIIAVWQFDTIVRESKNMAAIDERLSAAGALEREMTRLQRSLSQAAERQDKQALLHAIVLARAGVSQHLAQAENAFRESAAVAPATLRASMASMEDNTEALERLAETDDWMAIRLRIRVQLAQVLDEVEVIVDRIAQGVSTARVEALREIEFRRHRAQRVLIATAVVSLVVSILLGLQVTRSITVPLAYLKRAARQLASSNFRLHLETGSKDELAEVAQDLMAAARHLETSYSALKRSNEDLERFAAAVSHDLREPLRTVSLFADLLKAEYKDALRGQASEYLALISNAALQMNALIDGILQYSRLTAYDAHEIEDVALDEVVKTAISNLRVAVDETEATVRYGALPVVKASRVQMVQVFQNLIGNAIKYRREGVAPHIDVQARNSAQSWIVSVADNGMGIPAKYQERVFGIFQQLHRQSGGVGLGLAVAKRVIQQLGGSIWVESDGQNGSCFFLELPMSNQQNGVEAASADRAVTSRSSRG